MKAHSARLLAALLAATGTLHFVAADAFSTVVPPVLGNPRPWVYGSGVVELVAAGLLIPERTRRLGGLLAFVTLLGVWPANVYAAMNGGYASAPSPLNTSWFAWLRVPLQLPLLWWASRLARR